MKKLYKTPLVKVNTLEFADLLALSLSKDVNFNADDWNF